MIRVKDICAGVLSLGLGTLFSGHAWCQAPETTVVASAAPAVQTRTVAAVDAHRQIEIDLQLAWLADPITFPYYLEAQYVGAKLEIRGHVPNRRVHDQALKHAFEHANTNILDAIRETPGVETRSVTMPADQVQSLAQQTLQRTFGTDLGQMRLEVKAGGTIVLLGSATHVDQKRAFSQCLRHVPGCTSIVNQLEIAPNLPPSPTHTETAAPATHTLATAKASPVREEQGGAEVIVITPMKGKAPTAGSPTPIRTEPITTRTWVPPQVPTVTPPKVHVPSPQTPPSIAIPAPTRPVFAESQNAEAPPSLPPAPTGLTQTAHTDTVANQASHLVPALKRKFPGVLRIAVQHQDKNRVRIDLWVNTAQEGHRLISELDRMEELAPYFCETHIHHN